MALETVEDIVSAGVAAQASIDKHLALAYKAAKRLTAVTEAGVAQGMVQGIAAKKIIADLGSVTTAGGITIGGVGTLGGGR